MPEEPSSNLPAALERAIPRPRPLPVNSDEEDGPAGVSLTHRVWVIRKNLWYILGFTVFCTVATAILSYRITPIYESTATIEVDRRAPVGVVGQDANSAAIGDSEQFLNTQVRLLQSDAVLKPVAREFGLNKTPGSIGMPNLKVSRPPSTFLILVNYRSPDPARAAAFANAVADSFIAQTYTIRFKSTQNLSTFMEKQIEELRVRMERSTLALVTFEKDLNMVKPEEINGIITARLVQLNTEYTAAQADRINKMSAWESLKSGNLAAAEISNQGAGLLRLMDRVTETREKQSELEQTVGKNNSESKKAAERLKQLTDELEFARADVMHRAESEYRQANNREAILRDEVTATKADFDKLNTRAFQYQSLKREAEADRKLYEELSNRIKESGINAGFQNSSIRVADAAQPALSPVYPNIPRNIQIALLISLALGIAAALGADALDATLRSPEDVERALGIHVVGILPMVKVWQGGWLESAKSETSGPPAPASRQTLSYEDAIQTLRDSILLSAFGQPLRTLMVTSASPAEGKTTTAAHLAMSHALQRHKTLLIECDLRRPGMKNIFSLENNKGGMAHVLSGDSHWRDQLVTRPEVPGLDLLPAGTASRRYADLIGRALPTILREAGPEYDLIVIDSPPLLGFGEPLQLASAVDGVVLVALAGKTNRKAVASAITTLQRLRVNLVGVVLNEVTRTTSSDYYHYGYYGKYYGS